MNQETNSFGERAERGVTRRKFVGLTFAGSVGALAGGSIFFRAATTLGAEGNPMFKIGGDLSVRRLGFGAMRITGDGIWGEPKDRGGSEAGAAARGRARD